MINITDDYETIVAFQKFNNFWEAINIKFSMSALRDTEDTIIVGDDGYHFIFASDVPPLSEMNTCIDTTTQCLDTSVVEVIDENFFTGNSFNLGDLRTEDTVSEVPMNGFDLCYVGDTDLHITVNGTGTLAYLNSDDGEFYGSYDIRGDTEYWNDKFTPTLNQIFINRFTGDFYKWNGSAYVSIDRPSYLTPTGELKIKAIFLCKEEPIDEVGTDFVMAYCRFATSISVKNDITVPSRASFIRCGVCGQ